MTRIRLGLLLSGIAVSALVFQAQGQTPQTAYRFQQIVPGVYSAIGTGTLNVGSNSAVVVNADDILAGRAGGAGGAGRAGRVGSLRRKRLRPH